DEQTDVPHVRRHDARVLRERERREEHVDVEPSIGGRGAPRLAQMSPETRGFAPGRRGHRDVADLARQLVQMLKAPLRPNPQELAPQLVVCDLRKQHLVLQNGRAEPGPHILVPPRMTELPEDIAVQKQLHGSWCCLSIPAAGPNWRGSMSSTFQS